MNLSLLETRLERLFYKSIHEIERRQSRRPSEFDPPPTGDYQLDFGPGSDPRPHPPRPRPEDPDPPDFPDPRPPTPAPQAPQAPQAP